MVEGMMASLRSRLGGFPANAQKGTARINACLETLCRLKGELGHPTGPYSGSDPQLFLAELDKVQCLLRVPIADRSHRRSFTRNYQQLLPDMRRRYRQDVVVAALEKPSPLFVNGNRFDASPDVSQSGSNLVIAWAGIFDGAGKKQLSVSLLEKFDAAYADFERKYLLFLIATEASCKSIVEDCSQLAARIKNPSDEDCVNQFIAMMQTLNSLANTAGKGRQDLGVEILVEAQNLAEQGTSGLPFMCSKVVSAYNQAVDYFAEAGKNMDKVDPHLARNRELVTTLATWEESWERAKPFMGNENLRRTLCMFVADLNKVSADNPDFEDAVAGSDVEAMMILPQLFAAFCAHHGEAAADIMEQACETTFEAVGLDVVTSCGTRAEYEAMLNSLARNEVHPELQSAGMKLQRTNPSMWNNFLITISGEL